MLLAHVACPIISRMCAAGFRVVDVIWKSLFLFSGRGALLQWCVRAMREITASSGLQFVFFKIRRTLKSSIRQNKAMSSQCESPGSAPTDHLSNLMFYEIPQTSVESRAEWQCRVFFYLLSNILLRDSKYTLTHSGIRLNINILQPGPGDRCRM